MGKAVLLNNPTYEKQNICSLAHLLWLPTRPSPLLPKRLYRSIGLVATRAHRLGLVWRAARFRVGQDDVTSWALIPLLGFTIAGCALNAIIYGLMSKEQWNAKFNQNTESPYGQTNWLTIFGLATSLLLGTTVLMASIVFSFQRYFENQIEQAKAISQVPEVTKP